MTLYQEPRQIPTYMAAIVRRHRFTILIIICILILFIFSWNYRRKDKIILNNRSNLYNYVGHEHVPEIIKLSNDVHIIQPQFTTDKESFPEQFSFPINVVKETNAFQLNDVGYFIEIKQESTELKPKAMKQLNKKLAKKTSAEEAFAIPVIRRPQNKFLPPSKNVTLTNTKYLRRTELQHGEKRVTLSNLAHLEERLPAPDKDTEMVKDHVTLSLPRKMTKNSEVAKMYQQILLDRISTASKISNKTSSSKNLMLLIDTPGCKIPDLDPWDPTLKDLIELQDPYICPGPPVFMNSNPGGSITLNSTILEKYYNITPEDLICYYQPIYRKHEEVSDRELSFILGVQTKLEFDVVLNEDHVHVKCNVKGKDYEQYFPLVHIKKDVEDERNSIIPPNPALNVFLLGIDSVSRLNFLRHFPRTRAFLNEKLNSFEMKGYTKVGDNTFPNIVPLLTGQFVERWWNETVKDTMFFDDVRFIWKEYAKRGYRTFYAEDNPFIGIFNYMKRGFYNPPTDYYFRPLSLAMEMSKFISNPKRFCFNSQLEMDIIYDHLKEFAQTMGDRPYFGFAMLSAITHDKLNNAAFTDEPTVHLLEGLLNAGALNNTVLVLFSDHGLRFGDIRNTYIGKFEERLPLMHIHVPKWFLEQYPEIGKNLRTNQDRLMTVFDIHATMLHFLDLNKTHEERSMTSLGTSLFEEITPDRTCADAFIQTHFCPCQTFEIVALDSSEARNASQAMVDDINSKLEPYGGICEVLEIDRIMDVRVGKANKVMLEYVKTENEVVNKTVYIEDNVTSLDDYMITLVTKPGGAIFEGTVRHDTYDNSYRVLGLSRINMYGNTSWCIDSLTMKLFCYCKIQNI